MPDWVISTSVGVGLIIVGIGMLVSHVRAWGRQQTDEKLDEFDLGHYRKQFRRRMQASSLLVGMGILIPVGDVVVEWLKSPILFAVYVLTLLLMSLWVILLGMGDLFSTRAHGRVALSRVRQKRRALEAELAEIKRGQRTNGHVP